MVFGKCNEFKNSKDTGVPWASLLKKFPHLPIACANISPGTIISVVFIILCDG